MALHFIQTIMELFGKFFMFFWNIPMWDLGFNFGSFFVFCLLIKFAMSIFLNIDMQPVSTKQLFDKAGSKLSKVSKKNC